MKKILKKPIVLSLLMVLLLAFFYHQFGLSVLENNLFKLTVPFSRLSYNLSLKIRQSMNFFKSRNRLEQENAELKEEQQELLSEVSRLKRAEEENLFLRRQLGLALPEDSRLILANVVGQGSSSFEMSLLIDKGREHGVKHGNTVITAGNLLVGKVVEVFDSFSRVQPALDPSSRINARLEDREVTGLVKGEEGVGLSFDLVPQGEEIKQGELVLTSGLAGIFPAGLLIGRVQQVISSDIQILQSAKIRPAADFFNLGKVFVIEAPVLPEE